MISLPNFLPYGVMSNLADSGSARRSRVGEGVLAFADFFWGVFRKDCFGGTPKPARETPALPGTSVRVNSLIGNARVSSISGRDTRGRVPKSLPLRKKSP